MPNHQFGCSYLIALVIFLLPWRSPRQVTSASVLVGVEMTCKLRLRWPPPRACDLRHESGIDCYALSKPGFAGRHGPRTRAPSASPGRQTSPVTVHSPAQLWPPDLLSSARLVTRRDGSSRFESSPVDGADDVDDVDDVCPACCPPSAGIIPNQSATTVLHRRDDLLP
ncbi:unnamed protein product, partial [Protopolystoma xenopodis]